MHIMVIRIMFRNILSKTLWTHRYALFWWSFGFIALSFYLMYFFPYISRSVEIVKVLDKLPPFIKNMMGDTANLATPEGFFNIQPFSMMAPLLFLIFSISKGIDSIAGEKERGTLELLLASPISRSRIVFEKFVSIVIMLLFISVVFWVGMTASALVFSVPLNKIRLLEAIFSCFMFGITFTAISQAMGCLLLRKKVCAGIVAAFAVITYFINVYAPMVKALQPYRIFSPFYYYNGAAPLINGLNMTHLLVQMGLAVIFFVFTILIFQRRDIL